MSLLVVSHRKQQQQADCLAACAAMVLDYLHIQVDYRRLLRILRIRAYGAAFSNLHYLQALGLRVEVHQGTFIALQGLLAQGLPIIVAVDTSQLSYWSEETDHAVVVVGMDHDTVYVHDPDLSDGPQPIPMPEFELAWLEHDYRYAVISL